MAVFSLSLDEYIQINEEKHNSVPGLVGSEFEKTCLEIIKQEYRDYEFYLFPLLDQEYKNLFNLAHYDLGIDILGFNTVQKKAFLIQCKYTKIKDKTITYGKDRLSHLFAQQNRFSKSDGALQENWKSTTVLMTTGKTASNAEKDMLLLNGDYLNGKLGFVDDKVNIINSVNTDNSLELRQYQINIINKLTEFYDFDGLNHEIPRLPRKGKLLMATGTGKTLVVIEYIKQIIEHLYNNKKSVIFVAPTLALVEQLSKSLYSIVDRVIKICSDGTTDSDYINSIKDSESKKIYVSTYDSLELLENVDNNFIILDEAHHAVNEKIQNILNKYQNSDVLYLTATEKIYDSIINFENSENTQKNWKQIMKEIPLIEKYNIGQGISDGYLTDYNIDIISFVGDKQENLMGILLDKILTEQSKKIVIYCNDIKKTQELQKYLGKKLHDLKNKDLHPVLLDKKITNLCISGEDSITRKTEIFTKFTDADIGIIFNVRILSEGIDLPCIDTVFFYNNRKSRIELIQNIGRCLRLYPGKKFSSVCINLDLNDVCNLENLDLEESDLEDTDSENSSKNIKLLEKLCKPIYKTLMYLANEDSTFLEYYRKNGKNMGFIANKKINFIGLEKLENLENRVISETYDRFLEKATDSNWEKKYDNLCDFIRENNRLPKEKSGDAMEKGLGIWISNQRRNYKKDRLSQNRIEKLEGLDLWVWDLNDIWNEKYGSLRDFIRKNGRLPKQNSDDNIELGLGLWVKTQRTAYKKNNISQNRIEKLEGLDLWVWDLNDIWNEKYGSLRDFIRKNGRLPNKNSDNNMEVGLGSWIHTQRTAYKKDKLDSLRYKKLLIIPELYLDNEYDTLYQWARGYRNLIDLWTKNGKFPRQAHMQGNRFYRHIHSDIKFTESQGFQGSKKLQKYIKKDIWCIENKKLPNDLSLASKYLVSLSKKITQEQYCEAIKKIVDEAVKFIVSDEKNRQDTTNLEVEYLIALEKLYDDYGIPLEKTRTEKLEAWYDILQILDKVLKLIECGTNSTNSSDSSDSPNFTNSTNYEKLIRIFAFYHTKAYPDNMLDYIRDQFKKNDFSIFVVDLDDVWS